MGDNRNQQQPEQQQTSDPVAQQLLDRYSGKTEAAPPQTQDPAATSLLQRYSSSSEVTPQSSSTEPPPSKVLQGSVDFWDFVKAKYVMTDEGIKRGWLGTQIQAKGGEGYEQAVKPSSEEQEATQTIEQYRKQNDLENNFILNALTEAGAGIPAMIPFMGEMAKGAAAGGALGGGAGAVTGIGALPLAGTGALIGGASAMSQIIQGQSYLDMRAKGISHDKANPIAVTSGAVQGAISMINFNGVWGKAAESVGKVALGSWSKMAQQFLTQHLKTMIPEIGFAAAQQAAVETIGHVSQGIAALMDHKPGTNTLEQGIASGDLPKTLEQAAEIYTKSFVQNLIPFTALIAAGKVAAPGIRLMTLAAKRTTRVVKAIRRAPEKVPELEKEFQQEQAQREEKDLISEINKLAEQEAQQVSEHEKALKKQKQDREQAAGDQRKIDKANEKERNRLTRARDRVKELEAKAQAEQKNLEAIQDEEKLLEAEKKLTKLQAKLLRAKVRLDQVETGNAPDYAKQRAEAKAARAAKRLESQAEVRRILDVAKSKFFAGNRETRFQEALRILRLLKGLVTSSTKLDGDMKSHLLERVIEINGTSNLERWGERFLEDLQDFEKQTAEAEAKAEFNEAIDELKDSAAFDPTDNGKSKFANHISEEYKQPTIETFQKFKEFISDELARGRKSYQGLAKQALDAYHKAIEQQKDPLPFEADARIAAQVIGLLDKSPEAVRDLAEHLDELKQDGLDAAAQKRLKSKIAIDAVKRVALEELQQGEKLPTDITQADPEKLNKIFDGFKHAPSFAAGNLFSWDGMMRWASMFSKDPEAFLQLMDVHKPTQEVATAVRKATDLYHDLLAKHSPDGTFGGAVNQILKGAKVEKIGEYTKHPEWVEGAPGRSADATLSMSPNQAVKLWMQLQDRLADSSRIHGSGYTKKGEVEIGTSTEELLTDYFTRPDRKAYLGLANALREFYNDNFKQLSDAVWDEYGIRPEQNKEYSGYLSHDGDKWDSSEDFAANWNGHVTSTLKPSRAGMTFERVESKKPMAVGDAFTEVYQQISLFNQWNTWRRAHMPLSAVFGDQAIRNVIKQKFGDGFMRAIDTARTDIVWGAQMKSEGFLKFYNTWLKQYADVVLLARPMQFFKQTTGFLGALEKMDAQTLNDGFRDFFKNPEKNWARLSSREFFKNRFENVMDEHLGALIKQGFEDTKITKLKEYAGIPVSYGDKVSSVITGHTVYYAMKKAGMTEAQALLEAEKFVNESQSSGTMDQLSNAARNPALKVFTLLSQQPTRRLEQIVLDVQRAIMHPSKENRVQAIRTIQGATVASIAFSGVGLVGTLLNPLSSDNQRRSAWQAFAVSYLDPVFGAGGGIGMGSKFGFSYLLNKTFGTNLQLSDPSSPAIETIKDTFALLGDFVAFVRDPSLKTFAHFTRDYLFGVNVIVPAKPIIPLSKGLQLKTGLTKIPISGYPLLEGQKLLEAGARIEEGDD